MAKLLYFISEDWFFCSHFMERAKAAQAHGFEVLVLTRETRHGHTIRNAGFRLLPLKMERSGTNIFKEFSVLRQVWCAYQRERPDLVHHVALKPIIYGSMAARWLSIRGILNAPVGMGYVFTAQGTKGLLLRSVVRLMLRGLMNPPGSKVVFENEEDLAEYVDGGSVHADDALLIKGAGVDATLFYPSDFSERLPIVVMGARLLRDKGVYEFVGAAKSLVGRGIKARFWLVGAPDPGNPSSIAETQLAEWKIDGAVELLGHREDMPALLRQCQIACLPSYREGLPKFLIEAMSCGLALVATNVPGCRQLVQQGHTGLLVPVRDVMSLALAIEQLLRSPTDLVRMGAEARKRVEAEFSTDHITRMTTAVYHAMCYG